MRDAARWAHLLAATWLGLLLAVALVATPAPFATLSRADAGRVAARVLSHEAHASLAFGVVLVLLARARARREAAAGRGTPFGADLMLTLGALFCTVAGYFALQPLIAQARAGEGRFGFAALHAASTAIYAVKVVPVAALAWRLSASGPSSSG